MEQLKHTPAPWGFMFGHTPKSVKELEVLPEYSHNGKGWKFKEIKIGDAKGRIIGEIKYDTTISGVTNEEFEANAKLIIASPDLLEALIETQKRLHAKGYGPLDTVYAIVINAIDKAIQ